MRESHVTIERSAAFVLHRSSRAKVIQPTCVSITVVIIGSHKLLSTDSAALPYMHVCAHAQVMFGTSTGSVVVMTSSSGAIVSDWTSLDKRHHTVTSLMWNCERFRLVQDDDDDNYRGGGGRGRNDDAFSTASDDRRAAAGM